MDVGAEVPRLHGHRGHHPGGHAPAHHLHAGRPAHDFVGAELFAFQVLLQQGVFTFGGGLYSFNGATISQFDGFTLTGGGVFQQSRQNTPESGNPEYLAASLMLPPGRDWIAILICPKND